VRVLALGSVAAACVGLAVIRQRVTSGYMLHARGLVKLLVLIALGFCVLNLLGALVTKGRGRREWLWLAGAFVAMAGAVVLIVASAIKPTVMS
jgi:hypothetical protein